MPKLLLFAPCEKIIIEDKSTNVSFISLLDSIRIGVRVGEIPEGAAIPLRWSVITMWWRQPDEEPRRYEQQWDFVESDGRVLVRDSAIFVIEGKTHRHITQMEAFPLPRRAGQCLLKLYLREDAEGSERTEITTFPLAVEVQTLAVNAPTESEPRSAQSPSALSPTAS
jgi:hypothetical protein